MIIPMLRSKYSREPFMLFTSNIRLIAPYISMAEDQTTCLHLEVTEARAAQLLKYL